MKKISKLILCAMMCMTVIFTCASVSSAASVKKVKSVSVSSVAADKVTLKWKKVSGVTGYRIYRYSSKKDKYVYIGKTKKLKYTDTSLTAGKTYKYKVRAYKTKKKKTTYGSYSSVVKAVTNPKKVKNLKTISVGTVTARITWSKATGATGYTVYVYDSKKGKYVSKGTTTATKYTLKRLSSNTKYKVKVAAYHEKNGKVYGVKSNTLTFRTDVPAVSSLGVTKITASSYTLTWDKVSGAEKYQIARYNQSEKKWKSIAKVSTNSYVAKGLSAGSSAQYKVRAIDTSTGSDIYGAYSTSITASTLAGVPKNLKVTADGKTITLTWTANGAVTGYEISRYNPANGTWEDIGTSATATYTDSTIKDTSTYTYKVRGYTQALDGKYYTDYTSSVSVFFESTSASDNIYSQSMAESGVLGYLYDPAENCFYTASDPWHRLVGYNELFDTFAPITFIDFDTARLKFDYNNKNWMIQLWKGQYGLVFYGAEIGVYNKPMDRSVEHYDCASDDELIKMSMDFYEYSNRLFGADGWEKKFSRPYGSYWWCTGFIPGNKMGNYSSLRIDARLTMKDYEMLTGVKEALESNNISYTLSGLDVYISYQ